MAAGVALAQDPALPNAAMQTSTPEITAPAGYTIHQSVDFGGRIANQSGAGPMYNTMVNLQSGPRMLDQMFEMRALPNNERGPFDTLRLVSNGFGGDPDNFVRLDFSKGKTYDFSGMFRRDRQYFDYNLLGNPNIPGGQFMPIGPSTAPTGYLSYAQVNQSPFLYNTVRRMTDINFTAAPLAKLTYRFQYSQGIFQGPSLTPSGYQFAGSYSVIVQDYQRMSSDDFLGGIDWKPVQNTRFTYEEEIDHEKVNSYFTLPSSAFNATEAGGTGAALLYSYFNLTPYTTSSCNANSMNGNPMLSAPTMSGGLPIVNAACAVITGYYRSAPTRILFPTEIFRLQSSSIKNVALNGDAHYTNANMTMPAYYESFQGLAGTTTQQVYTANGSAKRAIIAADFGIVWQVSNKVSLADQITFSNVHQPGVATMTGLTTESTGTAVGSETINSPSTASTAAAGKSTFEGSSGIGAPLPQYFGQSFLENNFTVSWDVNPRATFALTYRHGEHNIVQTAYSDSGVTATSSAPVVVDIAEDGGIFNVALRPASQWQINGSVEAMYNDNALTPMGFRQFRQYRAHTLYRPKTWAVISGAFSDRERHNNTNNTGAVPVDGPLEHVDHSRFVSLGTDLYPNEHYGLSLNYVYSDVYSATNICYDAAASATLPGAATPAGTACPDGAVRGTSYYMFGPARDFIDAPTNSGSAAITLSPNKRLQSNIGYRISAVSGSQFLNDARTVNGSLNSTYQSPFASFAWLYRNGWTWKAEYNFYGYGEGGPSGAQYCSTSNPTPGNPVTVVPCNSLAGLQTGMTISPAGETAARNFHANNVLLGVHYEF